MKHTEITKLTNKANGEVYEVITEGTLTILVILIHKFTVWRLKRYLKFTEKFNRVSS